MSWFKLDKNQFNDDRPTDKRPKTKNQTKYMKKTKLPTQSKTKKCSFCRMPMVTLIVNNNEKRRLCKKHRDEYFRRDEKQGIIKEIDFRKASDMI